MDASTSITWSRFKKP